MAQGGRIVHERALPNWQCAVIDRSKLERYVLDPTHAYGRHKAVVFKSALGFEQSDWEVVRDSIIAELPYHEALLGKTDRYDTRYNVTIPITGMDSRNREDVSELRYRFSDVVEPTCKQLERPRNVTSCN